MLLSPAYADMGRVRAYDAPRCCTYVQCTHAYTRACARLYVTTSLPSCTTHDARAPFAFACPARKSRVHALLRARVCSVCVCRVPQRTEKWTREKERYTPFRFRDDTSVICSLSYSREDSAEDSSDTDCDHTRINYAARFIGQQTIARPACVELRYFHEVPSA